MNRSLLVAMLSAVLVVALPPAGCVRRTLTIETEPQGALVYLNDEEVGPTPMSTDFTWYGDYDVIIRKEGFQTYKTHVDVKAPWYQLPPIDFFFDVLWPGTVHDRHHHAFTLEPWTSPEHDEVVSRALQLREQALTEPFVYVP